MIDLDDAGSDDKTMVDIFHEDMDVDVKEHRPTENEILSFIVSVSCTGSVYVRCVCKGS